MKACTYRRKKVSLSPSWIVFKMYPKLHKKINEINGAALIDDSPTHKQQRIHELFDKNLNVFASLIK